MARTLRSRFVLPALAAACALTAGQASAAMNDTRLASLPTGTDGSGNNGDVDSVKISADGRYVTFQSTSDNLAANDNDAVANIYVRDMLTNTTVLASLPSGNDGSGNDGNSFSPAISADGRYVAFHSVADNLAGNDNNAVTNVFVRDMASGTTELVSAPTGTDGSANNANSSSASISADGRFVAFSSSSDNLATNDSDAFTNVYVRDVAADVTRLASLPPGAVGTGNNGSSVEPSISADGRFVAFSSHSDNLATNDNNSFMNVYVRDLVGLNTTLVSLPTGTDGSLNGADSTQTSISGDGRYVAFGSGSDNMSALDANGMTNLHVRDVLTNTTVLVSAPTGSSGALNDSSSLRPSISADGRYVAFHSGSDNLATNDNNSFTNVFVRDLVAETTTLASLPTGTSGALNDAAAQNGSLSGDGRYAAFESHSNNLATNDNNLVENLFVRTLLADPPRNLGAPRVSGEPLVGKQLTCSDGSWTEGAITRAWRRNEEPIAGAAGVAYTVASGDAGQVIDCLVTATNADGSAQAASNAVVPTEPGQGPQGPAGTDGSDGADGMDGAPGPQGPAGPVSEIARLLIGLISDRVTTRSGARARFRYLTTDAGAVELRIRKRRKVLARVTQRASAAGKRKLVWNGRRGTSRSGAKPRPRAKALARGRYTTEIVVAGGAGRTDRDTGRLRVR